MQALHVGFEQRWQFGRDIVFTYGPWGFLSGGYYPPTFITSVIVWVILAVVFWWVGWRLACHFSGNKFFTWLWLAGFIGVASISGGQSFDIRGVEWVLLLLFLHFFVEERAVSTRQLSLAIALGLLSLVKFTSFIEAVIVVGVIAADTVFRRRKFPWIAAVFAGSILFFWMAAGQQLDLLWPFLLNSRQMTDGYAEAMQLGGVEISDVICFLFASAMLVALTGYVAWNKYGRSGIFPVIALAAILFLTFKHGYVRCDSIHETTAALSLLVAALASLAVSWPVLQREKNSPRLPILLLVVGILFFSSFTFNGWFPQDGLLAQFASTFSTAKILAPAKSLANLDLLKKNYAQNLASIRKHFPTMPIYGTTDIYPWNQMVLFANGLQYDPRPVIQSYSAYTPQLAGLNATWLQSARAPSNILFEISPVNNHFPSLDDGLSWPELLTRYDIADTNGEFLLLKRAAAPRQFHLTPVNETTVQFGESFSLPATTNAALWAEMEINKSVFGKMIATFYNPPNLRLMVSLRDGRQIYYRMVPGMARGGFLLSPLIGDKAEFVSLASTDGWRDLSGLEVTAMTISAATKSGATICYESTIKLRLYRLDYPRQNLNKTNTESVKAN